MSLRLRLRLVLSALVGALLLVTLAGALQFRELAALTGGVLGPDARMLEVTAHMQRLVGEPDRGPDFDAAFEALIEQAAAAEVDQTGEAAVRGVVVAFRTWQEEQDAGRVASDEAALRSAVAALSTAAGQQATRTADVVRDEALTAALGLGLLAALTLILGAWVSRVARTTVLDRLEALDQAVSAVLGGQRLRRLPAAGSDELGRLGDALNQVLDLRDRSEAAMDGRNRELRALMVALLHRWPRPAAITGVDGEVMVSTLDEHREAVLRSITTQLRAAATTLLSRQFSTAAELETTMRIGDDLVAIQALATDAKRVVGWLSTFPDELPRTATPEADRAPQTDSPPRPRSE